MILNLKNLHLHVEYNKFKMDTLQSILKLVTSGCPFEDEVQPTVLFKDIQPTPHSNLQ